MTYGDVILDGHVANVAEWQTTHRRMRRRPLQHTTTKRAKKEEDEDNDDDDDENDENDDKEKTKKTKRRSRRR